jgi:hypothetical protein
MAEKKIFHRSGIFYILSGILLIILTAGFFIWRNYKYKLVNKKIDNLVTGRSKGLYQLTYQHLVIDEALGNISVEEVEMLPDSLVYQTLVNQNTAPETLFYIRILKLLVTGVKTPKALLNKEIRAHIIRIQNAEIEIRIGKGKSEKQSYFKSFLASEQYRQLLGKLKSIRADSVVLENASLTVVDKESKNIRCKATGLSIRFAGIAIDTSTQNDSSRMLFSNDQTIHCNQLELPAKNKVYDFKITGLDYNSQSGNLHTDQIRLIPSLSETAFVKANKYSKDRFNIAIGSLDIIHIKRQALLHQQLVADSLQITDAYFHDFMDKSSPHDSVDRTHDYPQESIMRLSLPVYVKKIILRESYIEYKEKNDESDSSGKVAFFNVRAVFSNVTNMPDSIRKNSQLRLHFEASFLNVSPFTADISMRINDRKGNFQMDAKLGEINAVALNPLLKPMALAEMNKGKISWLQYHLDATNTRGKVKLVLKYDELSIKLLKKDKDKNKYKTKFLPTLATGILLKGSNPQNGKMRIGNIDYARDIHSSVFVLMWKSLFAGIKQVAL